MVQLNQAAICCSFRRVSNLLHLASLAWQAFDQLSKMLKMPGDAAVEPADERPSMEGQIVLAW